VNILPVYLLVGFAASLIGSMLGLGGGFLALPVVLALAPTPSKAVASVKFMVFVTSLVSTARYASRVKVSVEEVLFTAVPMVATAYAGAYLVAIIPPKTLLAVIGTALLALSLYKIPLTLFERRRASDNRSSSASPPRYLYVVSGSLAGFVAGITGLGGGVVNMPVFLQVLKLDPHTAVSLSMACILPSSLSSVVRHLIDNLVDWSIAVPLSIGAVFGGLMGPTIALKMGKRELSLAVSTTIAILSLKILAESLS